jgi:hypothetical protein
MAASPHRLAAVLVRSGRLTQAQADELLTRVHTVWSLIVELDARGWVADSEFARAVADAFKVPFVDLASVTIADDAKRLLPSALARKFAVVPLDVSNGRLRVALVDPSDITAIDAVAVGAGCRVEPVVASLSQIRHVLDHLCPPGNDSMAMLDVDSRVDDEDFHAGPARHDPDAELRTDSVDFSVFAPPAAAPGSTFVIELWAYLRRERSEVLEIARRDGRTVELFSQGPVRIPAQTELTVLLALDGLAVRHRRATMFWTGSFVNASFVVSVPADAAPGDYAGEFVLLRAGMRLTSLFFHVTVGAARPRAALTVKEQPVRTAFASYASTDRDEVLRRVQGITAAGVDVFLDVLSLRAGDDWEQGLLRNIRERDVFYLFWSRAASSSGWVEKEWRYALKERGADYIHPIPLADPREVPPPPDLATKHFNDVILACLASMRVA